MFAQTQNVRDENGDSYIPASQRPDGTWRKARRVKDGYVPQEEVPLYESKGRQLLNRRLEPAEPQSVPEGYIAHKSIPGLFIAVESDKTKSKKKKEKKVEDVAQKLEAIKIQEPKQKPAAETAKQKSKAADNKKKAETNSTENAQAAEPAKKLRNLKKRLREIEALEDKVESGELAKPDPDQLTKIKRKPDLLVQIRELEKQLGL